MIGGSCIQLLYNLYPDTPKSLFVSWKLHSDFYKTVDSKHFKQTHEGAGYIRIAKMKNNGNMKCW